MKKLLVLLVLLVNSVGFTQKNGYKNVYADVDFYPQVNTEHLQYADSLISPKFWDSETYCELLILYINEERRLNNLSPLVKDGELMKFAQKHTDWMCRTGKYEHSGENIKEIINHGKTGSSPIFVHHALSAQICVRAWMHSEGHKSVILNEKITKIGAGYGENYIGSYKTAVFK